MTPYQRAKILGWRKEGRGDWLLGGQLIWQLLQGGYAIPYMPSHGPVIWLRFDTEEQALTAALELRDVKLS